MMVRLMVYGLLVAALYGCREFPSSIQEFIPGTYSRYSAHAFGHEYDTLVISLQNDIAHEYLILRKWKYERLLDGVSLEPEYKQVRSTGYFSKDKELLEVKVNGEVYSFDPKRKILFNGTVQYQKL